MKCEYHDGDAKKFYADVKAMIDRCGWMVLAVGSDPPFCYTIGMHQVGLPELLMRARIQVQELHQIVNAFAAVMVKRNSAFADGEVVTLEGAKFGCRVRELQTAVALDTAVQAFRYYNDRTGADVKVIQLLIPDSSGRFPGDIDCDPIFSEQMFASVH